MRNLFLLPCCALAVQVVAQSAWSVSALGIKPSGDDFAPVLLDSNLVIASIRERAQAVAYTDPATDKPLSDLYEVRLRNGKPGHPRLMDGSLSTPYNDGPADFSPSGDTICITRNVAKGNAGKRRGELLGLFFAVKENGNWSAVRPFRSNGDSWSVMHGSFSPDGRTLYFASDKHGGQGGTDLYRCTKNGTDWGEPENLGTAVNSRANDLFPSLDAAGLLHFSSDREGGLGKLDIYGCAGTDGRFEKATALPAPINSAGNDIGWAAHPDLLSGYFSSDREGTGRIYAFTRKAIPFQDCVEQKPTLLCYAFEDEGSFNTDTLPLQYEWDFGDGERKAGLRAQHCYRKPGTYAVKLNIMDTLSKSVYFNETGYDLEVKADVQAVIGGPDSAATGSTVVFDGTSSNLPGFFAKEMHWDLGDSTRATGDTIAHAFARPGDRLVRLDLIGAPDRRGGFEHHCVQRTVHVIDAFQPSEGVQAMSDPAKAAPDDGYQFSYGELPNDTWKASLQNTDDLLYSVELLTSATRVGLGDARFIPIRHEYPVMERFLPKERLYSYSIGSGTTPVAIYNTYAFARKNGFTTSTVKAAPKEKPLAMDQIEAMPLEALDNSVLHVNSVRFKTGERAYDPSFNATLDRVLQVIRKYPAVELVIEAHTDNVGTEATNTALSSDRAQGIVDYFMQHGIDPGRLRPIGYGEDRPVADNGTEAGRAANRRVDFRLNVPNNAPTAHP